MKALYLMTLTEAKLALRNFFVLFFAFVFPSLLLLLFGSMYGNSPSDFYGGHGAVDILAPAYMGMVLASFGLMTLPVQLTEYRQQKVLKRFRATPIGPITIMAPQFIVNGLLAIVGTAILILVGVIVFQLHFFGNFAIFFLAFMLSMLCIYSIGLLIASVAPNNRAGLAISYLIFIIMLFLSGATIPLQIMPDTIVTISKFLPLTYCVELMQGIWLGGALSDYLLNIGVLIGVSIVCIAVSVKVFRWE